MYNFTEFKDGSFTVAKDITDKDFAQRIAQVAEFIQAGLDYTITSDTVIPIYDNRIHHLYHVTFTDNKGHLIDHVFSEID